MDQKGEKRPDVVQFMKENYSPRFTYADFAPQFTAEFFDPDEWARIFKASGAKYVVLTSKHHEGFTLWPSKSSFGWNALDTGPRRNLLGDLAVAVKKMELRFGVYHSMYEWFNPLYIQDRNNDFKTQRFVAEKTMPELLELVNDYKPEVIWSDGDWEADYTYWNSTNFLSWLYNDSPVKETVVVNDRWGRGIPCKHGDFYTCSDRYNPGKLLEHKWENCMTIDKDSWGYRRTASLKDYLTTHELIKELAETVSCGGNLLMNIGPTADGRIIPIFEERLIEMGEWLQVNGEAIYESHPWKSQEDSSTSGVWYTQRDGNVYGIVLFWPKQELLYLHDPLPSNKTVITLLGYPDSLSWKSNDKGLQIVFPSMSEAPGKFAWVIKMTSLTKNKMKARRKV
ncbi:hypothetical protein QYM36_010493 [Artemia franciscana]|uniref:Putative alpha-L-fucosidase n=1 Tax=Artemia franciscana TaxID=6661 RepID=A0AA88HUA2_ARTSF|nr:hypothetical protein QYM36_010493 [Artemia franciscana]